jgi:hypothetical protein
MIALLEARSNEIRVAPVFARARQLPGDGRLVPADVARVVLGWAPESRNWHLGLMLAARPETNFHTRWCGLASWPSGVAGEIWRSAKRAGQVLARIIDRPFHLVPPAEPVRVAIDDTQPLQATVQIEAASVREAVLHAVPLHAPPFEFDEWTLVAVPRGLIWQRRGRWVMLSAARAIGLAVLSVLFLLLGIGVQTRGLADVNPSWLPWLRSLSPGHWWSLLSPISA